MGALSRCTAYDVVDDAGVRLAQKIRRHRQDIPVVFITNDANKIFDQGIDVADPMMVRPKSYAAGFMVMDVVGFLEARPRLDRVFLIYGRNKESGNIKEEVVRAIEDGKGIIGPQIACVTLEPETAMSSISEELQRSIGECGAVVAICTPDDKVGDSLYQPWQNVLVEIGMSLGISDGFRRLVLLQRWGEDPRFQAQLPSDLGGALSIRFYDDHERPIDEMLRALRHRGIVQRTSPATSP